MGQRHQSIEEVPACELVADAVRRGARASDLLAQILATTPLHDLRDLSLRGVDEVPRGDA